MNASTLNLEAGRPTAEEAVSILSHAIDTAKQSKRPSCYVLIHGYGSHGTGGAIRTRVRSYLEAQKATGRVKTVIYGENFSLFNAESLALKNEFPNLSEYLERYNAGITIVKI